VAVVLAVVEVSAEWTIEGASMMKMRVDVAVTPALSAAR
jgi:hypothetical protein